MLSNRLQKALDQASTTRKSIFAYRNVEFMSCSMVFPATKQIYKANFRVTRKLESITLVYFVSIGKPELPLLSTIFRTFL